MIEPRILQGFRDLLPEAMIPRERLIETAQRVYRSFGYVPIDTPVLEYLEILTGKGSEETDRQMYSFEDHGNRKVGMRFDLTVPLARFAAMHIGELGVPFKRYHIGKVWRGERPQAGRFREFMQCDFDTIGSTSIVADIETGLVIHELLRAIGFERFQIQINNRKILSGILAKLELTAHSVQVLRTLDKLDKIGPERVGNELTESAGASNEQVAALLQLTAIKGTHEQILSQVADLVRGNDLGEQGLDELTAVVRGIQAAGVPSEQFRLAVSIARGLDYYTGTVYETMLDDLPKQGSVCSGGRYDDLASAYSKQKLPGIGASLGLDRLLDAMQKLGMLGPARTAAQLLVTCFDTSRINDYLAIASRIRSRGIGVEVYPEAKKIGQQFKYANRQGFQAVLVAGADEFDRGLVQVKWLESGEQVELNLDPQLDALVAHLHERLNV